jgi:hypothetical protein
MAAADGPSGQHMAKPILYLFRGKTVWQVSLRGIPEEGDFGPDGPADSLTAVSTPFPRDMDVEDALRATRALYPDHEVRILNWHRPKRDV